MLNAFFYYVQMKILEWKECLATAQLQHVGMRRQRKKKKKLLLLLDLILAIGCQLFPLNCSSAFNLEGHFLINTRMSPFLDNLTAMAPGNQ